MNAPDRKKVMLKFLRRSALYIFAIPLLVYFFGAALNQIVINANHDTFPVLVNEAKLKTYFTNAEGNVSQPVVLSDGTVMLDEVHCVMTDRTHLNFLADVFDIKTGVYSIGDIFIAVGQSGMDYIPYVWGLVLYTKQRE